MKNLLLLILCTAQTLIATESMLLKPCASITSFMQEENVCREWSATWHIRGMCLVHLNYQNGQVCAGLLCDEGVYNVLPHHEQQRFSQTADGYIFLSSDMEKHTVQLSLHDEPNMSNGYTVYERRAYTQAQPQEMSLEACAELINNKRVVFYTGAGISAAADVYTMHQLQEMIGLRKGYTDAQLISYFVQNSASIKTEFALFCQKAFDNEPTEAHWALKKIVERKQCQLFTENFDFLHERTGMKPIKCEGLFLKEHIDPKEFAQIDAIICLGLSEDDRGFLGWYKEHNPAGVIVAIDLAQPNYVSDEDFLVRGDLQTMMPQLHSLIR